MFKILNKYIGLQWFLLALLLILAGYQIFKASTFMDPTGFPILYKSIFNSLSNSNIARSFVVSIVLFLSIIGVQHYFSINNFATKSSLYPSIIYLSILVLSGNLKVVSPIFFTNFFIIIILLLNDSYFKGRTKSKVLYSGMFIGLSLLIDPSTIVLFLFLITSMIINTVISPKDIIVSFFGILIIGIYLIAYYFFTDSLDILWENFSQINLFNIFRSSIKISTLPLIFTILNSLILLYLIVKISLIYETKVIVMRKKVITLNALLICLIGTILLSGIELHFIIRYFYIPISLLISILVQNPNKYFLYEILITIFFIGICL